MFNKYISPILVKFLEKLGIKQPVYRLCNVLIGLMIFACLVYMATVLPITERFTCQKAKQSCNFSSRSLVQRRVSWIFHFSEITNVFPSSTFNNKGMPLDEVNILAGGWELRAYVGYSKADANRAVQKLKAYLLSPQEEVFTLNRVIIGDSILFVLSLAILPFGCFTYLYRGLFTECKTFNISHKAE